MSGGNHSQATFDTVLDKIRKESKNTSELGTKFEKLTKDFLETDTHYRNRFRKIWMWMAWPDREGQDTGIDLVAEQYDGSLCAIQCKCYADDGNIDTKQVSKFLAKATGLKIEHKILVYTGENITSNATRLLRQNECGILTSEHLRQSSVDFSKFPKLSVKKPKRLRPHQQEALESVINGFKDHDRGKMVMACGTGKTLASLHIAEQQVGLGGTILYLVPSISLILQSMREWSENANLRHYYVAVCSDKHAGGEDGSIAELESPVSTDVKALKKSLKSKRDNAMTVVFSTYHSIGVVRKAVKQKPFDLILCDEAHRTTGVESKSFFITVHEDSKIRGKKRLYMTATPRVYSDIIRAKMNKKIYSMDDEEKYGPELYKLSFSEAVKRDILSDFRVKIAIVPEKYANKYFQQAVSVKGNDKTIPLDQLSLMAGVWHAIQHPDDGETPKMLQKVIAFTNKIDRSRMFAGKIKNKDHVDISFERVVRQYNQVHPTDNGVDVDHVDGKNNALYRRDRMRWLDASTDDPNTCRILSNARCLTEGVDVPSLDGVVFLNPRKSRVDVVQAVGRVMRKSLNKDFGYVILPVALPAGKEYHESLDDNDTYKIVWQVLNALRSHDEDFGMEINQLILDPGSGTRKTTPRISVNILDGDIEADPETKFFSKMKSKLVAKVGDFHYYDKYGKEMGKACRTIEKVIRIRSDMDPKIRSDIDKFHRGLKQMINDSVTVNVTIQAIAQHVILSRVFDALFQGQFTSYNPISTAFGDIVKKFGMREELDKLEGFYADVDRELETITTRKARQEFIKTIYGTFFEGADKKGTEKHGIVYTPVEIIDFILRSVQHILKEEFEVEFNNRNVKVLDPFTGTGTFLARLLESGMITDNMYEKYKNDLFANEIILLAYYIATVNIETTYSSLRKNGTYVPFDGINYTDTWKINPEYRKGQEYRQEQSQIDSKFKMAHQRVRHQRGSHLHVIVGNPPYSAGQNNFNDQNQNTPHPVSNKRIQDTYLKRLKEINRNITQPRSLYDSYIRSLRWASDRIGESGIVAFVTNASFIRSEAGAGIRACFWEEFNEVWCFDLRGNQRTKGEISIKEGGKIFGSGSRAPVAITILVKKPKKKDQKEGVIHYKDIGDYLTREQKLETIKNIESIQGIEDWQVIKPDRHHDWLDQRCEEFSKYMPISSQNKSEIQNVLFTNYWNGLATSRDTWVYNSSPFELGRNMKCHIDYCNKHGPEKPKNIDSRQAKWSSDLSDRLRRTSKPKFNRKQIRKALYRPFFKQDLYLDKIFIERPAIAWNCFPKKHSKNLVICIPYRFTGEFSTFMTDMIPDLELVHHAQCFPLHVYEKNGNKESNITGFALQDYREHYKDETITKEDIFYYVYALFHHLKYKEKFANNLTRELPHIPLAPKFWAFSRIGKKLADLHLNFDKFKKYDLGKPKVKFAKFDKLSFGRKKIKKDGKVKPINDKTKLRVGNAVVFDNIPEIKYRVNGKTPLEWIIDKYQIKTDKKSGITNDPCTGTDIIAVIGRAIYVGVESDRLISQLPKEFEPENWEPTKTGLDVHLD